MRSILYPLLALALALPAPAYPQNLPDLGESSQAEFSPQTERKLGDSFMREIRRDPAYIEDPEVTEYIRAVGRRLIAATPETAGIDFEFFAVRDPNINAFAMPGGYVGVHSGLIISAMVESEFASVLAHEMAHVTQRHIARQLQNQSQIGALSMVGMALAMLAAKSNPQVAQAAVVAGTAAPVAAFLNYSRDFEREADRVGYQILRAAHYDVQAMPTFFERLQRNTRLYENNAPGYLRTHPLTTERIADMQNRAREAGPVKLEPDSRDFQIVRAKLRAQQGDAR
ncbi:MAG TPA: M48 family metalloprotease, partial [Burkholderiales bacterium]